MVAPPNWREKIPSPLRRRFSSIFPERRSFDAIVCSYGGGGTTMLLHFLASHLKVNSWNSGDDGVKHIATPGHPVLAERDVAKAVYIFADPAMAALSLFRRNYVWHTAPKLHSQSHKNGSEYRKIFRSNPDWTEWSEFLDGGRDIFGFEKHWRAWNSAPAAFPIALVRYETIFDELPALFSFLKLPVNARASFPAKRERESKLSDLPSSEQDRLMEIYSPLREEIASAPNFIIRDPG